MKTADVVEGINTGIKWVQEDVSYALIDGENTYATIPVFDLLKISYSIQNETFALDKKRAWSTRYKILDRNGAVAYEFKQSAWSLKGLLTFSNGARYQLKFENSPMFSISVYVPGITIPLLSYGRALTKNHQSKFTVKTSVRTLDDKQILHAHVFAFWMFRKMIGSTDDDMTTLTILLSAT